MNKQAQGLRAGVALGLGVVAAPAAADFDFMVDPFSSLTQAQAIDADGDFLFWEVGVGPSVTQVTDFNSPDLQGDWYSEMSSDYLGVELDVTGVEGTYALASVATRLTVSETTHILAEWDFTGINGEFTYPTIEVYDVTNDVYDLQILNEYSAGSQALTLETGIEYRFTILVDTEGSGSADGSIRIVPAPGAAALLGVGGLAACRRRRR